MMAGLQETFGSGHSDPVGKNIDIGHRGICQPPDSNSHLSSFLYVAHFFLSFFH
jgi:hypothetical protein